MNTINNAASIASAQYVWTSDNGMYCGNRANIEVYLGLGMIEPLVVNPTPIISNRNQLIASLYGVAKSSLASANKGNPFISKSDAMRDINQVRKLLFNS